MSYYFEDIREEFGTNPYGLNTAIRDYTLVCTCGVCPEQYDVFDQNGNEVGYIRLRHGRFSVKAAGQEVYSSTDTYGDGCFADSEEREKYLLIAVKAIEDYWKINKQQS